VRQPFNPAGHSTGPEQGSDDRKTVEAAAVRMLARREHSIDELRRKLLTKGYAAAIIEPVIEKLAGKRLISDRRFTSGFVHHHAKRGQGPVRIRAELRQQGIPDTEIEEELRGAEVDWQRLAAEVRRRKFGAAAPRNLSERAKQSRFLQYRGFDAEQIRAAFRSDSGGEPGVTLEAVPVDLDTRADPDTDGSGVDPDASF
jgi:regulatory protein